MAGMSTPVLYPNRVSVHPVCPPFESSNWVGGYEGGHCSPSLLFDCGLSFRLNPFEPPYRRFLNTRRLFNEQRPEVLASHLHDAVWPEYSQRAVPSNLAASSIHPSSSNEHFKSCEDDHSLDTDNDEEELAGCPSADSRARARGLDTEDASNPAWSDPSRPAVRESFASRRTASFTGGVQTFNEKWVLSMDIEHKLRGHQGCVNTIHVDSLGQFLLSGSDDRYLCMYNTFTWELLHRYSTGHTRNIFDAKFLPYDCTKIVSCGMDGETFLLDTVADISFSKFSSSSVGSSVLCSICWPNTAYVAYGDGRLVCIDTRCCIGWSTHSTVLSPTSVFSLNGIATHERCPYTIACATDVGYIFLVDIRMNSLAPYAALGVLKPPFMRTMQPFRPQPSPYGSSSDRLIRRGGVSNLSFSERGDWLAINFRNEDAFIIPWQSCLQRAYAKFAPDEEDPCNSMGLEASNRAPSEVRMHLTGGQSIPIVPCSVSDGMRCLYGRVNCDTMFKAIIFLEDDTMVCTGSDDGSVVFWRSDDGKYLGKIPGDGSIVNGVLYPPSLKRLLTCGLDSTVKVFAPMLREEDSETERDVSEALFWSRDRSRMVSSVVEPLWPAATPARFREAERSGYGEMGRTIGGVGEYVRSTVARLGWMININSSYTTVNFDTDANNPDAEEGEGDSTYSSVHSYGLAARLSSEPHLAHDLEIRLTRNPVRSRSWDPNPRLLFLLQRTNSNEEGDSSPTNTGSDSEESAAHSNSEVFFVDSNEQTAPGLDNALHSDSSVSEGYALRQPIESEVDQSETTGPRISASQLSHQQSIINILNALILSECLLVQTISSSTNRARLAQIRNCLESVVPEFYPTSPRTGARQDAPLLDETFLAGYSERTTDVFAFGPSRTDEEQSSVARSEEDSLLESFSSGGSDVGGVSTTILANMTERRRLSSAFASAGPSAIRNRAEAQSRGGDHEGRGERRTDEAPSSRQRQGGGASNSHQDPRRRPKKQKTQDQYQHRPIRKYLRVVHHLLNVVRELFEQRRCLGYNLTSRRNGLHLLRFFEVGSQPLSWETCSLANPMFPWLRTQLKMEESVRWVSLPPPFDSTLADAAPDERGGFIPDRTNPHGGGGGHDAERAFLGIAGLKDADHFYDVILQAESNRWLKGRQRKFGDLTHRLVLLLRVVHLLLANHHPACLTARQSRRYCALLACLHAHWVYFYMSVGMWDLALIHCDVLDGSFEFANLRGMGASAGPEPLRSPPRRRRPHVAKSKSRPKRPPGGAVVAPPNPSEGGAREPPSSSSRLSPSSSPPSRSPTFVRDPDVYRWVPNLHAHLPCSSSEQGGPSNADGNDIDDDLARGNTLTMPMRCYRKLLIPLVLKVKILAGAIQVLEDQLALQRRPREEILITETSEMLSDLNLDTIGIDFAFLKSEILLTARAQLQRYMQGVREDFICHSFPQSIFPARKLDDAQQHEKTEAQVRVLQAQLSEAYHELRRRMRQHPNKTLTNRILSVLAQCNILTTVPVEEGNDGIAS
ncbi:unnamed protein product [Phytomonas sp. EM1]|nr:unnamed protein product [Phytomonas sp. EM1]|eukprot:CCW63884.1 unnamed protein product [Phytomonas sp. isolate EM1]